MTSNDRMLKFIGGFIIVLVLCGLAGIIAEKKDKKTNEVKLVEIENTSVVREEVVEE